MKAEELRFSPRANGVYVTEYRGSLIEQAERTGWYEAIIDGEKTGMTNSLHHAMNLIDWNIRDRKAGASA